MNYAENKDVNDETSPPGQIGSDDDDDENYDGAKWTHSNSDTGTCVWKMLELILI